MAGYILQGKTESGSMVNIPLAATYDSAGNNITNTYATKSSLSSYVQTSDLTYASESDITAMFA